ncbi:hypothetical protein EYF80_043929 [Liparis tanakae]|uniref:Uncharacterized protein n=1 Tax=Liparis tanakae TaxID=230148 RepID=A0A4Z2FXB0_9TELE|nr:hypothetical protein EYF80_043929 [Liparis tanakae]
MQKTGDGSNCGASVIEVLPLRRRLIRGFMLVTTNEKGSRVIAENARHKEMRHSCESQLWSSLNKQEPPSKTSAGGGVTQLCRPIPIITGA